MDTGGTHPYPEILYYHIALDALESAKLDYKNMKQAQAEYEKIELANAEPIAEEAAPEVPWFKMIEHVTTSMVFSALCLEAFINQEYEEHLKNHELFNDLERLSLEAKWRLLPLLLGSSETFNTGAEPYQTFDDMIFTRNQRFVHFKPDKEGQPPRHSSKKHKEYWGNLVTNIALAEKYLECVGQMIQELHRLTNGKTDAVRVLQGGRYISRTVFIVPARPMQVISKPSAGSGRHKQD
jgi:hypothetical protein